ncbi:MAG: ORF6N domain-containing protein [Flavobacteriaceae bacterium]|nr:ORF6N domain-containing protein [Flavobacteriaceae bacterium]
MNLQEIQSKIYTVRNQQVMFDFDLAELYQVETRVLKQSVKRNIKRFPLDFMFTLNEEEINLMVSQNVIPSKSHLGGAKPFAFTEQGVAMLSGVLKSDIAIEMNIIIVRAFVQLRKLALTHTELSNKLNEIEQKYNKQFENIYEALNYLLEKDKNEIKQSNRNRIGYK